MTTTTTIEAATISVFLLLGIIEYTSHKYLGEAEQFNQLFWVVARWV